MILDVLRDLRSTGVRVGVRRRAFFEFVSYRDRLERPASRRCNLPIHRPPSSLFPLPPLAQTIHGPLTHVRIFPPGAPIVTLRYRWSYGVVTSVTGLLV